MTKIDRLAMLKARYTTLLPAFGDAGLDADDLADLDEDPLADLDPAAVKLEAALDLIEAWDRQRDDADDT